VRRRRRWRRLRVAVLVLLVTSVVLGAAVGIDRLAVAVHKFYDEHHHSSPPKKSAVTHGTSTTTTTAPGTARCTSPALSAVVSDWRDTGGAVEENVQVTNISATPCTVAGYPALAVAGQGGTLLPATNDDLATIGSSGTSGTTGTTFPGPTTLPVGTTVPPTPVPLAHGAVASFQFSYANICDHVLQPGQPATGVPNECYSGTWLEVTPAPGAGPLVVTVPLHLAYQTSGFEVGPYQAGGGPPLTGQPPLTAQTTSPPGPSTTG
jgi:hypothetical protein